MKVIAVSGPESTGKTAVSIHIAQSLGATLIPEYAREYISSLKRPYTFKDVEHIAATQIEQRLKASSLQPAFLVLDTWLIITKIWFTEAFHRCPEWIDDAIKKYPADLFLLCEPDIPWVPDPVRENGGERRSYLFSLYAAEIRKTGVPCEFISGTGNARNLLAMEKIKQHFIY